MLNQWDIFCHRPHTIIGSQVSSLYLEVAMHNVGLFWQEIFLERFLSIVYRVEVIFFGFRMAKAFIGAYPSWEGPISHTKK